ncbi:OmpA family protein [Hellea sp.]|nr:OmpA family protein [Hellea sp.]
MDKETRPIIIRRKKVYAADGHHGGAWKVAYADFVTAMMAFFLLMWLLNATTEEQRKGIADYFSPNIPIAAVSGGGSDALSGDTFFSQQSLAKSGSGMKSDSGNKILEEELKKAAEEKAKAQIEDLNQALIKESADLLEHVSLKMSPDGLVIELIDSDDKPLFLIGDTTPSDLLKQLLKVVTKSFETVQNDIKIVGHTDGRVFINKQHYSNWDLSTDRANTARRLLISYGFPYEQITEVSGKAYTDPLASDPLAAQNRRISIIILQ